MDGESEIWMVVAEYGSDWAAWADRFRLSTPDVAIVFQQRGESVEDFARRVRARTQRLVADGRRVSRAVFVPGVSKGHLEARSLIVRALTLAMDGSGQLMLSENSQDRITMTALATTLNEIVRGSGVSIAVARVSPVAEVA